MNQIECNVLPYHPMRDKTPEQRKASAAKGHATRKANIESGAAAKLATSKYVESLIHDIAALEKKLASLQRMETMDAVSAAISGKSMLRESEIARASLPWAKATGVYFLLNGNEVIYVGQSTDVYVRIGAHSDKKFDRYAFVPCAVDALNRLESLYIHCLRPRLNGNQSDGEKCAPIPFLALMGMVNK